MKTTKFLRVFHEFKLNESGAANIAVGALLLMTLLYATTMV